MAIDKNTLETAVHDQFITRLHRTQTLWNAINKEHEARAQNLEKFYIPVLEVQRRFTDADYDVETITPVLTGNARDEYDASSVEVAWQRTHITGINVPEAAVVATEAGVMLAIADDEAERTSRKLDKRVFDTLEATSLDSVKLDPSAAGTVDLSQRFGNTAANYVNDETGVGAGTGVNAVYDLLQAKKLFMEQNDMIPPTGEGGIVLPTFMPPHLYRNLELSLEAKNVDTLTLNVINGVKQYNLFGTFTITMTNAITEAQYNEEGEKVASGGVKGHSLYIIDPRGITGGERFKRRRILEPLAPGNDYADAYMIDMYYQDFVAVTDARRIQRIAIANGNT